MNSIVATNNTTDGEFTDELQPGTTLLRGQYVIESFLNSGGFGMTYLAKDSLDRIVVIKECFPASVCTRSNQSVRARSRAHQNDFRSIVRLFLLEARRLAKLDHPNIVGVHQVFEDNDTAYMALDFVDGLDLLEVIEVGAKGLNAKKMRGILLKTLDAVAFIHDQNILHRDISPDNILLDTTGNPVLIDFGAAREEASKASRALSALIVVKDGYSPQEFYIAGSQQGPSSDLYALAATFYHLIVGDAPPNSQTRLAAIAEERDDPYRPIAKLARGYDQSFLTAIDKALSVFPKDRFQSAGEWAIEIDQDRRVEHALASAENDKDMDRSISLLVSETNRAVNEEMKRGIKKTVEKITAPPVSKLRAKFADIARELAKDAEPDAEPDADTAELDHCEAGLAEPDVQYDEIDTTGSQAENEPENLENTTPCATPVADAEDETPALQDCENRRSPMFWIFGRIGIQPTSRGLRIYGKPRTEQLWKAGP